MWRPAESKGNDIIAKVKNAITEENWRLGTNTGAMTQLQTDQLQKEDHSCPQIKKTVLKNSSLEKTHMPGGGGARL